MKVCAIICEYNPFHFGHEYMISQLKKMGYSIVCIMSGNFTQRGIPAVVSKYSRAEMAIKGGADLVLELPFPYSSCNADLFCSAGVHIADKLGFVDTLAFGSESGDIKMLRKTAEYYLSDEYRIIQDDILSKGGTRLSSVYGSDEFGSNDILGIGYIKAVLETKSRIEPIAIKRIGLNSNDVSGEGFKSSKSIRNSINDCITNAKESVPDYVFSILNREYSVGAYSIEDKLFFTFQSILRMKKAEDISGCVELNDELANRIISSVNKSVCFKELIEDIRTKIYSESKVMRALLMASLGVIKEEISYPCYTVLLGANENGRSLLKQFKKEINIPVITKQADYTEFGSKVASEFELLKRADSIWNLSLKDTKESGAEMKKTPFIG
ncbi:MAG: nucleotidyltransferase family protein [Clostridiales bacterium]|nr:nucleotidyltransferase family protein [Clostridiales bacterium]